MKHQHARFLLFMLAMALTAQMSIASSTLTRVQNTNSSTISEQDTRVPAPSRCRIRCRRAYGVCIRLADGSAARRRSCMLRYRTCLRRCGR
ncbi:MAG: hypothetical protein QOJ64_4307 [Acidobacteriota bacterium]|jgi:hypothetical protein|nr:hypothetical protein [Acidobacteriota bacterium]